MKSQTDKWFIRLVFVLAASVLMFETSYADEIIGTWCDKAVPNMPEYDHVITIVKSDDGKIIYKMKLQSGESGSGIELRQISARRFERIDNHIAKDNFEIIQGTGNLQLSDIYGPIRKATALANEEAIATCLKGVRP